MPGCPNFGVAARDTPGKPGPSPDRDPYYARTGTAKGRVPAIRCKGCGEKPPLKSNAAIAEEIARLRALTQDRMDAGCSRKECENHGASVREYPERYRKHNKSPVGRRYECRSCARQFSAYDPPPNIHKRNYWLAKEVYSRIANKMPMRRVLESVGISTPGTYYTMTNFIRRRCNSLLGKVERALTEGRLRLPETLRLATDVQEYTLNWTNRLDRRNAVFSAVCTTDADSRFVFGLHANYDPEADAFAVNKEAAEAGDFECPEAFRRHARLWLAGDEFHGGRPAGQALGLGGVRSLTARIRDAYRAAESRQDIEDPEGAARDPDLHALPCGQGMQIHLPYTLYAHFFLLQERLTAGGVLRTEHATDCESALRAAFLSAFRAEVAEGRTHGFYVKIDKYMTRDERESAVRRARSRLAAFRRALPPKERDNAARLLMERNLHEADTAGRWRDRWVAHPCPTMNEPEKAVCWLTPNAAVPHTAAAQMHLDARIAPVDNVFQVTRRFVNALERPIGTSSGYNRVWHGYAPYNPAMVQTYLDIFRATWNFCHVGDDGSTPAMRLGLLDRPLIYDDVLWPGEEPPRRPETTDGPRPYDYAAAVSDPENPLGEAPSRRGRARGTSTTESKSSGPGMGM